MTIDWNSYVCTESDGTWQIAFRNLSFPRMMQMIKLYVENERDRADVAEWPAMPDEGI